MARYNKNGSNRRPLPDSVSGNVGIGGYVPGISPGHGAGSSISPYPPDSSSSIIDGSSALDGNKAESIADIKYRVENSEIYRQAYALFSSSPDYNLWLQRLVGILDSINTVTNTWLDDIGLSNHFNDSVTEAYNYAIEQIQSLLSEFQTWRNSLPSTQVQQLQDAGINSAITGQNVSSSVIDPQSVNRPQMQSADPLQGVALLADIALTKIPGIASTIAGVWQTVQGVRQLNRSQSFNEKSWLANTRKSLIEQGYTIQDGNWNTIDDFNSWTNSLQNDPAVDSTYKKNLTNYLLNDLEYQSLASFTTGTNWSNRAFGVDLEDLYNDIGNYQLRTWRDTLKFKADKAKYDSEYWNVRDGKQDGDLENIRRQHETFVKNFEKAQAEHKLSFLNKWIDRASKSKDPVAKFAVNQILFQDPTVALLDTGADLMYNIGEQFKQSGLSPLEFGKSLLRGK